MTAATDEGDAMDAAGAMVLDAPEHAHHVERVLEAAGIGTVRVVHGTEELGEVLAATTGAYVLADPSAAGVDVEDFAARVAAAGTPTVLMGRPAPVAEPFALVRLDKPVGDRGLIDAALRARQAAKLRHSGLAGDRSDPFAALIGDDPRLRDAIAYARAVALSGEPVLITGETGTGKDLIAQGVHAASRRRGEFVALNVAGFDDALFSDALFGHRKGAYTGALEPRLGMILRATAGTLFLDEVGDLAVASQVKLLRLLEDGTYLPLGSDLAKHSSARVVAATSAPPADLAGGRRLRTDLYYRLRVHHVHLPPLRERLGDLPVLCEHFLRRASRSIGRPVRGVGTLVDALRGHAFPGNVRELRAIVHDAAVCAPGEGVAAADVRRAIGLTTAPPAPGLVFPAALPTLTAIQDRLVDEAMIRADGHQATAAAMLGITRQALSKRLRRAPRGSDAG